MIDYERDMATKKSCKNCEYGSFEHLLFLFVDTVVSSPSSLVSCSVS